MQVTPCSQENLGTRLYRKGTAQKLRTMWARELVIFKVLSQTIKIAEAETLDCNCYSCYCAQAPKSGIKC